MAYRQVDEKSLNLSNTHNTESQTYSKYGINHKVKKDLEAGKLSCNLPKIQTEAKHLGILSKRCKWNRHSEDPDQTAPLGHLAENLGSLQYSNVMYRSAPAGAVLSLVI